jgi:Ca2+-binding RTX toxin-like protein
MHAPRREMAQACFRIQGDKMTIKGTKGNDVLRGTANNDIFVLNQGGNDIAMGLGGNDTFQFGTAFTARDQISGGNGNDTLSLSGDYSASHAVTLRADTLLSVENIKFGARHDYKLTTNDANVAKNHTLTVDASKLGAANILTFNGSHETDGHFAFIGGKGNDILTGGAQNDSFTLARGGNDNAHGGAGNDSFAMNGALTAADKIDGGAGTDVLNLSGNYFGAQALTFGAKTVIGVEKIVLANGHDYDLATSNATVAAGATLTVDGSALSPAHELDFDGSRETDGHFHLIGGGGNDMLTGGALSDVFDLTHGGIDTASGGGGDDSFHMGAAFDAADQVDGGDGQDTVTLSGLNGSDSITLTATTMTNVEVLQFASAFTGTIVTDDATVASGQSLTVDAHLVTGLFGFNGAAETDGGFTMLAGSGANTLTGGAGNDTFHFLGTFDSGDAVDGGGGYNILYLDGDYSGLTITSSMLQNVQDIELAAGHAYNITIGNGVSPSSIGMVISGQDATGAITVDASAETSTGFSFAGGSGNDTFTGGGGGDFFEGIAGADTFIGNGGNDGFSFGSAAVFAATTMDGGSGSDTISLFGQSSYANTSLSNATSIEVLNLSETGHNYSITTADTTVDSGATLNVQGGGLTSNLTFDGSAETNGGFTIIGGSGDDTVTIGSESVMAASTFDGGSGSDTLVLKGDYSTPFTLNTITGVETVAATGDHIYNLHLVDSALVSGAITVDGNGLTGDGGFLEVETSDLSSGGAAHVTGGANSDDVDYTTASVFAASTFNGNGGDDVVSLSTGGTFTAILSGTTLQNIATLQLNNGGAYTLTTADGNVTAGATMTVDGSNAGSVNFDGSAETNGQFHLIDSAGDDRLTGGDKGDTFALGHGGTDTIAYTFAAQSTSINYDTITSFDADSDHIELLGAVASVNSASHAVTTANFDSDIAAACGGGALATHGALLITDTDAGSLNGHVFLVIDANGNAAYNAGADYVIDVTGHTGTFTTGTFTVTHL